MTGVLMVAAFVLAVYVGVRDIREGRPFVGWAYLAVAVVIMYFFIVGVQPLPPL